MRTVSDAKTLSWAGRRLRDGTTHWRILVKQVNLIDYDRNLRNPSIVL